MKACDSCVSNRVSIGRNHKNMPVWVRAIGLVFIYLPIMTLPFSFLSAYLSYYHLWMMGVQDVKKLKDFLPERESHRYDLKSQITMDPSFKLSGVQSKLFWLFNCTWYCPVTIGFFEWHSYLVKLCDSCISDRIAIGESRKNMPVWLRNVGLIFTYLPIMTLPFSFLSAYLTYYHLSMTGAQDVKKLKNFLPEREIDRFNSVWYCCVTVGLFEWHSYLVKLVENFWCPFTHGTKESYCNANIDKSFWHIYPDDAIKLHEDDLKNPIWNEDEAFKTEGK